MEKIDFEDIRVGDRIRVTNREEYANGDFDTETTEFTVIDKTPTCAEGTFHSIYNVWSTITLLDRPKTTFKVGDTITGKQVTDLPDGAVFDLSDGCVALRYKIDLHGSAQRSATSSGGSAKPDIFEATYEVAS